MQPKMTTRTVVRMSALSGISCFEWTFAKNRLAGSPPSLQFPSVKCNNLSSIYQEADPPSECVSHATACGHDTYGGEEQADEWEPRVKVSADTSRSVGEHKDVQE